MMSADDVLYLDNHVLVVVKPVGLLTQPSGTDRPNVEDDAKAWLKVRFSKPGNVFLEAVHRIDKDVSGAVLFARSSKGLSRLNQAMREHNVQKVYHALVDGRLPSDRGRLEHWLVHGDHKAVVAAEGREGAKKAVLNYVVLQKATGKWLVEVTLETGRYHQIRAQLAAVRCPILGDDRYGSRTAFKGIALHSRRLAFPHPVTREAIDVVAPYPSHWPGL